VTKVPKKKVGGPLPTWKPGDPALTVGEVAERLAVIDPNVAGTISKIRHWAREGMLFPVAGVSEGTGKHRQYAESAVFEAAVLMATTSAGMNVASTRYLVDAMTMAKYALPGWRKAKGPLYLIIDREVSPRSRTSTDILHEPPGKPASDLTIIIDLNMLWSRIEGA
jgi:DNA-binding transcriptional MerR regulator